MRIALFLLLVACGGIMDPNPPNDPGPVIPTVPNPADPQSPPAACGTDSKQGLLVADLSQHPGSFAAGGGIVYWTDPGDVTKPESGLVGFVDRCGGQPTHAPKQSAPFHIAADSNGACWTNLGSTIQGIYQNDGVVRCIANGVVTTVVTGERSPGAVTVMGPNVFWVNTMTVSVVRGDRTSADRTTLWGTQDEVEMSAIAVDGTDIHAGAMGVMSMAKDGSNPHAVVPGITDINAMASDETHIYFLWAGALQSVPKSGDGAMTKLAQPAIGDRISIDGDWIYYLTGSSVRRVRKTGGADEFAATSTNTYSFAIDDAYIYTGVQNRLYRTPKH